MRKWEVYLSGSFLPPSLLPLLSLLLSLGLHRIPIVLILLLFSDRWSPQGSFTPLGLDWASCSSTSYSSILGPPTKYIFHSINVLVWWLVTFMSVYLSSLIIIYCFTLTRFSSFCFLFLIFFYDYNLVPTIELVDYIKG